MATQEQYVKTITNDIKKKLPKGLQKFFEENKGNYMPGMLTAIGYAKEKVKEEEQIQQLADVAKVHAEKAEQAERTSVETANSVVDKVKKDYEKAKMAKKAQG